MDPDDIETEIIYGKQKKTHPDGGYGWLVVFCGFSVQFITVGMQNSSGTMLPALLKEYNQSEGATGKFFLLCEKLFVYQIYVVYHTGMELKIFLTKENKGA